MIVESDSMLAAPKPHRSHVSDVFTLVTEHLKTTSPILRFSSPHLLQQRISSFMATNTHSEEPHPNVEQATREKSPHPPPHLAEQSALPFLGEQPSVHEGAHPAFLKYDQQGRLQVDGMGIYRVMSRGQSLEGLASAVSTTNPAMMKLPKARSYTELSDSFESLPKNSWILPFIIACCPPLLLQQFNALPKLIDEEEESPQTPSVGEKLRSRPRVASGTDVEALAARNNSNNSYYLLKESDRISRPPFSHHSNAVVAPPQVAAAAPEESPSPFPPSWRSLGRLFLSRDPSWSPWEPKVVYLLDNYLLEATVDGSKVIGFAQLSGSVIRRSPFTDPHHRTTTTTSAHQKQGLPLRGHGGGHHHFMSNQEEVSIALQISCLTTSDCLGSRSTFWLTVTHLQDLEILESALIRASRLKVEDVFDLHGSEAQLLGRGRFNEVRLAQRKNYRIVDHKVLQRMSQAAAMPPVHASLPISSSSPQRRHVFAAAEDANNDNSESFQLLHLDSNSNYNSQDNLQDMTKRDSGSSGTKKKQQQKERRYLDEEMVFGDLDMDDITTHHPHHTASNKSNASSLHEEEDYHHDHDSDLNQSSSSIDPFDNPSTTSTLTGRKCALKLISKEVFWERVESGKERGDALVREVLAQLLLESHRLLGYSFHLTNCLVRDSNSLPFVRIFSIFETQTGFALELELMESMDLFDKLAAQGPLLEWQVQGIIAQLVDAVSFCNRLGIAHRDIKLSNITFPRKLEAEIGGVPPASMHNALSAIEEDEAQTPQAANSLPPPVPPALPLTATQPPVEHLIIKLADFGMAGFISATDKKLRGRCGTPGYVAPDILQAGVNEAYGLNVDMFSIGVVAYTLLCGYEPFYGQDNQDLLRANRLVEYEFHSPEWDNISEQAKDWIRKALHPHADTRLNPEDSKKHGWLTEFFPSSQQQHTQAKVQQAAVRSSNTAQSTTSSSSSSVRYYPSALHPHLTTTTTTTTTATSSSSSMQGIAATEGAGGGAESLQQFPWNNNNNKVNTLSVPQSLYNHLHLNHNNSESAHCILC